jgi:hypothetical protein
MAIFTTSAQHSTAVGKTGKKKDRVNKSKVGVLYSTISCRGLCLNYLKKISQTWWFSVGSILQYAVVVCV